MFLASGDDEAIGREVRNNEGIGGAVVGARFDLVVVKLAKARGEKETSASTTL